MLFRGFHSNILPGKLYQKPRFTGHAPHNGRVACCHYDEYIIFKNKRVYLAGID
jgi:hypothetical protein